MFALTYDETFLTAVAVSSILMVLSAAWIVLVLCNIEKTKVVALSTVLEDDGTGNGENDGGGGDLQFEESTTAAGQKKLELEPKSVDAKQSTEHDGTVDEITTSSRRTQSRSPTRRERGVVTLSSPKSTKKRHRRKRRVSGMFLGIQILSVSVLMLLTYLLLVVSSAPIALRILGSLCVFAMFLRYQIGDEIRRQRVDRIMLLLSLFLLIASMLSTLVYSMKSLAQGEIYEGPARIVGYDMEQYNNSQHDPTTRTDIAVSWGRDWGCPLSGGKVCQTRIQGAMCQTHPDEDQTKHKPNYDNNRLLKKDEGEEDDDSKSKEEEDEEVEEEEEEVEMEEEEVEDLEEDLEDEENSNQDQASENETLEEENEELKEEIEELKEDNEIEEEEEDELVDEENSELDEIIDEYDEDIMIVEEEEYEDAQSYVDAEYEMDEESIEEKIDSTDDDAAKEELEEELEEDEDDLDELDEEYEEDEEYFDEYADEFSEDSEEEYEEFEEEIKVVEEEEEEKDEMNEEIDETEAEINDTDKKIGHKDSPNKEKNEEESNDDVYEEMAEDVYEEEEEEIEEEYEEEEYDDYWYWDEYPDSYDDDFYEDEYWSYDWDSAWGDYACEDLFDSDVGAKTYDVNKPAGGDDWPVINIYGSCKTCESYILDYFAEEAFEEVLEYKQQAIVYLAGAMAGFVWATLSYVKYRVMPTAENEIELLGGDGGVMA